MTNVEQLAAKLQSDGLSIGGLTLGPQATPENVAGEILRSLKAIEDGDFELVYDFKD